MFRLAGSIGTLLIPKFNIDECGSMMPVLAAVLMAATLGAAVTVDMARAYSFKGQLQITADAAALAGAVNLPDVDAAREAVYLYARKNMPGFGDVVTADDIEFGHWDADGRRIEADGKTPNALRVTARLAEENGNALATLFAGVFGRNVLDIAASAVAGKRSAMCILTLEMEAANALAMDVAASIEALNCTVQVNSRHRLALRILLGSKFTASSLCVTGGAHVSPFVSMAIEPTLGCPPQPDPLADLRAPVVDGCDFHDSVFTNHHGTLQPGVYCGGLTIEGTSDLSLAAGVYVIKDGPLAILDTAKMSGEGVIFFLTGDKALIRFDDNSSLTLTAPTDGDMAGILVFQDRNYGGEHVWNSKAPTELHGTIYLPKGDLLSRSANAITPVNSCNVLIVKSLRFLFRSGVSIDLGRTGCQQYLPAAVLGTVALLD